MKLKDVERILEARPTWNCDRAGCIDRDVVSCHASDLVSDMLAFDGSDSVLLTGLTNAQVIRTAEILDFVATCLVGGKEPQPETVNLAQENGIPLFVTSLSMYECCGRLFEKGLPAGAKAEEKAECPTGK